MRGAAEGKKLAKIKSPKNQLKTKNFKKRRSFPTISDDFRGGVTFERFSISAAVSELNGVGRTDRQTD